MKPNEAKYDYVMRSDRDQKFTLRRTDGYFSAYPAWTSGRNRVSCWSLSFLERLKVLFTGKVWVWNPESDKQPAMLVTVDNPLGDVPF